MKKLIPLSLATLLTLEAAEIQLQQIAVQSTIIKEVAQNAKTSADVADSLSKSLPSIDMSRRSGVANDVFIRGQKRDNISVEVDGTKVHGACVNRMDPPISHVLTNQIQEIEVTEGPYDVTSFGTMSGGIKIKTKQPTKDLKVEVNIGFGAWDYKKIGTTFSGGNETLRVLLSASMESSDQYEDGSGNTQSQQLINGSPTGNHLQTQYEDKEAYSKKSFKAKVFVSTATNQELRLSVTANRSDNVLYSNSPMDAVYDDSNIYSIEYNIKNLSDAYKNLNFQYYYSDVSHPMSTEFRKIALNNANNITNHLWTTVQGLKIKNSFDLANHSVLVGVDTSKRTWDGHYQNNVTGTIAGNSIDNALTKNIALFSTVEKQYGDFDIKIGLRVDATKVSNDNASHQTNDYRGVNANIFTSFALNEQNSLFAGVGRASRVPDGRELYFEKSGNSVGTQNLDQTTNTEVDLGFETDSDDFRLKVKAFYSMLKDYIYIQKGLTSSAFKNIDAIVYGTEISATYYVNDDITLDLGLSYKVGEKDQALNGQTDKNLADMSPLRANLAFNYEYANNSTFTLDAQMSDKWDKFDADNGEQALDSWSVINMKVKHSINKKFDFTLGMNNMFNETYSQSNTYADLNLVVVTSSDIMLLNEPGRYVYTNLDFKF